MAMFMEITKWLSIVNIILILGLVYVYVKSLAKVKSGFTVGLLIFTFLFLVQNAVCLYFAATMMPYYAAGVESYVLVLTGMQTAAFAVMNYITWK